MLYMDLSRQVEIGHDLASKLKLKSNRINSCILIIEIRRNNFVAYGNAILNKNCLAL